MIALRATVALIALAASSTVMLAQARTIKLGAPTASTPNEFALINTIRELSNGSVMVADPIGGDLWLLDASLKNQRKIGREGGGPGEYRQPDAVWALRGDTTLLVDLGNARLSIFDEQGKFVRSTSMLLGTIDPSKGPPTSMMPRGTDAAGRIYFQGSPMGPGGPSDSIRVLRYDPATKRVDSLARIKGPETARTESGSEGEREVRIRPVPLSGGDGWAVSRAGALALGRAGSYRVEWLDAKGVRVIGPPVPYERVRVGSAEKKEWAAEQMLRGGVGMALEDNNGQVSVSFTRNRLDREPSTDGLPFPSYKPPFDNATMVVDLTGRVWVQRHLSAGQAPQYDVIAADGKHIASVVFPKGRRIVGFGTKGMYVTAIDNDGLQSIERYAPPV